MQYTFQSQWCFKNKVCWSWEVPFVQLVHGTQVCGSLFRSRYSPSLQDDGSCTSESFHSSALTIGANAWSVVASNTRNYSKISLANIARLTKGLRELSFFTGRGPYICDGRSSIFSGPPLFKHKKILVPPFAYGKKFWSPPLLPTGKKFWSPPPVKEHNSPLTEILKAPKICSLFVMKEWLLNSLNIDSNTSNTHVAKIPC